MSVIPPLVKEVVVGCPPQEAFAVFTAGVRTWWPLATHSVGGADSRDLVLDASGFVETLPDGTPCRWGTVLAWEPPSHLTLTWHPGQAADPHTTLDLTFQPSGTGTLVRLVHRGWENLRAPMESLAEYTEGWDLVLGDFVTSADAVQGARQP
jgi:uncharacterized protein YndB with AHSA1/START domain